MENEEGCVSIVISVQTDVCTHFQIEIDRILSINKDKNESQYVGTWFLIQSTYTLAEVYNRSEH